MHIHKQYGVTLLELLVGVIVFGLLSLALSPVFSSLIASQKGAYIEKEKMINQQIASAIFAYARTASNGVLPAPFTGSGRTNAIYDPTSTTALGLALTASFNQNSINVNEINDDGYGSQRVRAYQVVSGLTQNIPIYFQSGPVATLTYQYGVIYQTSCRLLDASCNPTAGSGVPGSSVKMTSSNYSTWTASGTDIGPIFISSLPLQKQSLSITAQRADKVRDSFVAYMVNQQRQAAATDTTNWYPSGSTSMGGATPGSNQGCRDGWYNLSTSTTILPTIGLTATEYGLTSWGGTFEYCRDYDPTGTKVANAVPHYGAIRFNKNVSLGGAPDGSVSSNNVVLTFGN